jgi:hypothetical protein
MTVVVDQNHKFAAFYELVYERLATAIEGIPYVPLITEDIIGDWHREIYDCWKRGRSVIDTADIVRGCIRKQTM